jgi:hypothetical protein
MNSLQNIEDVFSILHDGCITTFEENTKGLLLTVECLYLAEKVNPNYEWFYVELIEIKKLEFEAWSNPVSLPAKIIRDSKEIFQAELEILSADILADDVRICCNQHDTDYDYCGGNLLLNCNAIKIYDQSKNELSIDYMDKICNQYWNRL